MTGPRVSLPFLGALVLLGLGTMLLTALILELLGVPRPSDLDASRGQLAILLLSIALIAPLLESWIVLILADWLSRRQRPAACFATLWIVWAIAHLALQSDLRGIPPGVAGWAFLAPYFRVRPLGRKQTYWALVAVHAGINLLGAGLIVIQKIGG